MIKVTRRTTESKITVNIGSGPVAADYRSRLNTPISFLNHMIEHIVWRSGLNIEVGIELDRFVLHHLICEDAGLTVGRAFAEYLSEAQKKGAAGYGDGVGIIDEAMAMAAVSFEGRSRFDFKSDVLIPVDAEDMKAEDLEVFLDGVAQGGNITIHLNILKGENSHHIWEAAFRAVGIAFSRAFEENPMRTGMTAGVAGRIDFEIEKQ